MPSKSSPSSKRRPLSVSPRNLRVSPLSRSSPRSRNTTGNNPRRARLPQLANSAAKKSSRLPKLGAELLSSAAQSASVDLDNSTTQTTSSTNDANGKPSSAEIHGHTDMMYGFADAQKVQQVKRRFRGSGGSFFPGAGGNASRGKSSRTRGRRRHTRGRAGGLGSSGSRSMGALDFDSSLLQENGEFDVSALLNQAEEEGHVVVTPREEAAYYSRKQLGEGDLSQRLQRFRAVDKLDAESGRSSLPTFLKRVEALSPANWSLEKEQEAKLSVLHQQMDKRVLLSVGTTLKPEMDTDDRARAALRAARNRRRNLHLRRGGGADSRIPQAADSGELAGVTYPKDVSAYLTSLRKDLAQLTLDSQNHAMRSERAVSSLPSVGGVLAARAGARGIAASNLNKLFGDGAEALVVTDVSQRGTENSEKSLGGSATTKKVLRNGNVLQKKGRKLKKFRKIVQSSGNMGLAAAAAFLGGGASLLAMKVKRKFLQQRPVTLYERFCVQNKLVPKCKNLIDKMTRSLGDGRVAFAGLLIGSEQANAVVQSCLHSSYGGIIDSLDVSDNDIHDAALAQLLQKWAHQLRELDLSLNTVGLKATSCLVQALSAPAAIMQELNLSHSQLTSEQLELLGEGLAYNASLLRLNLSRNAISDRCGDALFNVFATQDQCALEELDISWNNMHSCLHRFLGLSSLLVLNVSMNALGSENEAVEQFASALKFNTTLLHLNMVHCHVTLHQAKLLAHDLCDNHTLLGLHIEHYHNGFSTKLDARGFLMVHTTTDAKDARAVKVEETHHTNEEAHLTHHGHVSAPFDSDSEGGDSEEIEFSVDFFAGSSSAGGAMLSSSQPSPVGVLQLNDIQQRHETTDSLATARNGAPKSDAVEPGQSAHHSADAELPTLDKEDHDGVHEIDVPWLDLPDTRVRTHADCTDCWLCGRWVEHHITWDNTHNLPVGKVFVHLQCDQFEPHELEVGKKPAWPSIKRYSCYRVLPIGRQYLYFSWEPEDTSEFHGSQTERHELVSMDLNVELVDREMVTNAKNPAEIVEKQKHKHRELLRRKRKRHIQLNSNVGKLAGENTPGHMDFSFDDPTGDYSNFAAALKAAKEAFPSDGEYEDSDYDSDDSDDDRCEMNYIDVHCHLIEESKLCGERYHPFHLPLHRGARPRDRGDVQIERNGYDPLHSIFAPRPNEVDGQSLFDTREVVTRCLEQDWISGNVGNLVGSDSAAAEVKRTLLATGYPRLLRIFQHLTAVDQDWKSSSIFLMKASTFRDFAATCELLDRRLTRDQLDLVFIAVNKEQDAIDTSGDDKTNNALRLLTRYEFLNAVVRIAKARAPAQFNAEPAQCVQDMLQSDVFPRLQQESVDLDVFRRSQLYTAAVDSFFHVHDKRLRRVFKQCTVKHVGSETYGRLEYGTWVQLCGPLLRVGYTDKHLKLAFVQSFLLVIDHRTSARYSGLTYLDFLEAIARLAGCMTASKAFRLFLYRGDDETDANGKPSKSLQELARESRARSPTSPSGSNKAQLFKRALRAARRRDMEDVVHRFDGGGQVELVDKLDVFVSCFLFERSIGKERNEAI